MLIFAFQPYSILSGITSFTVFEYMSVIIIQLLTINAFYKENFKTWEHIMQTPSGTGISPGLKIQIVQPIKL